MAENEGDQTGKTALEGGDSVIIKEAPEKGGDKGTDGDKGTTPATFETLGVTEDQFGKFYDAEKNAYNWQAHAKESEFKLAQKPKAADAGDDANKGTVSDADAGSAVSKAGLNMDSLGAKIRDGGDIDEADYKALEDIGIPRDMTTDYVELVKGRAETHVKNVTAAFGGDRGFAETKAWTMKNLTQAERDGYDDMLGSPQWQVAADALNSRMGRPPMQTQGKTIETPNQATPTEAGSQPFADQVEMNLAIQDKRYKTDPAYRAEVFKRAGASNWDVQGRSHTAGL